MPVVKISGFGLLRCVIYVRVKLDISEFSLDQTRLIDQWFVLYKEVTTAALLQYITIVLALVWPATFAGMTTHSDDASDNVLY